MTPTLVILEEGCGLAGNSAPRIFDIIHVVGDASCSMSYPVGKCHCMPVNRDDWLALGCHGLLGVCLVHCQCTRGQFPEVINDQRTELMLKILL